MSFTRAKTRAAQTVTSSVDASNALQSPVKTRAAQTVTSSVDASNAPQWPGPRDGWMRAVKGVTSSMDGSARKFGSARVEVEHLSYESDSGTKPSRHAVLSGSGPFQRVQSRGHHFEEEGPVGAAPPVRPLGSGGQAQIMGHRSAEGGGASGVGGVRALSLHKSMSFGDAMRRSSSESELRASTSFGTPNAQSEGGPGEGPVGAAPPVRPQSSGGRVQNMSEFGSQGSVTVKKPSRLSGSGRVAVLAEEGSSSKLKRGDSNSESKPNLQKIGQLAAMWDGTDKPPSSSPSNTESTAVPPANAVSPASSAASSAIRTAANVAAVHQKLLQKTDSSAPAQPQTSTSAGVSVPPLSLLDESTQGMGSPVGATITLAVGMGAGGSAASEQPQASRSNSPRGSGRRSPNTTAAVAATQSTTSVPPNLKPGAHQATPATHSPHPPDILTLDPSGRARPPSGSPQGGTAPPPGTGPPPGAGPPGADPRRVQWGPNTYVGTTEAPSSPIHSPPHMRPVLLPRTPGQPPMVFIPGEVPPQLIHMPGHPAHPMPPRSRSASPTRSHSSRHSSTSPGRRHSPSRFGPRVGDRPREPYGAHEAVNPGPQVPNDAHVLAQGTSQQSVENPHMGLPNSTPYPHDSLDPGQHDHTTTTASILNIRQTRQLASDQANSSAFPPSPEQSDFQEDMGSQEGARDGDMGGPGGGKRPGSPASGQPAAVSDARPGGVSLQVPIGEGEAEALRVIAQEK
eukprot:gene1979-33396_t